MATGKSAGSMYKGAKKPHKGLQVSSEAILRRIKKNGTGSTKAKGKRL